MLKEELMLTVVSLTEEFHRSNKNLTESLLDKGRGYGIVKIHINNLVFGIPLRSNITHRSCMVLDTVIIRGKPQPQNRGLDYTKAVLIRHEATELGNHFNVSSAQKKILRAREKSIKNQFETFAQRYYERQ